MCEMKDVLNEILRDGVRKGASDIHITAGRPVTYRIDGDLVCKDGEKMMPPIIGEFADALLEERPDMKKKVEESREADFAYSLWGESRFRVNIFHQRNSLAIVMRLLPFVIPKPDELGIPECIVRLCELKKGLILVTGATGSGKSTTLASIVDTINKNYCRHIITLEDPIEYLHRHDKSIVNQRELGSDTYSFAGALRSALRQDPDVILVGEMRDLDTISTAITAAETGHLVLSTLHTNDVASTIERIIDVFPPYQQQQIRAQLANVLEGVVSQQLIPLANSRGRVSAFEIMVATTAIRNLIRENKAFQIPSQIQTNKRMGMQTMDDALYDLYLSGRINGSDALHFSYDPVNMRKKLML